MSQSDSRLTLGWSTVNWFAFDRNRIFVWVIACLACSRRSDSVYFSSLSLLRTALYYLNAWNRLYGSQPSERFMVNTIILPPEHVPFYTTVYIVLCTIYPTFCVCHLSLHSRFNFFAFNIQLCKNRCF